MAEQPEGGKRRIMVKVTDLDTGRELSTHTIEYSISLCCCCGCCSSSSSDNQQR